MANIREAGVEGYERIATGLIFGFSYSVDTSLLLTLRKRVAHTNSTSANFLINVIWPRQGDS